jgi:hypothetical protein
MASPVVVVVKCAIIGTSIFLSVQLCIRVEEGKVDATAAFFLGDTGFKWPWLRLFRKFFS